jgi:hypothetical protein
MPGSIGGNDGALFKLVVDLADRHGAVVAADGGSGPVRRFAVAQGRKAAGAVPGGAARGDGHHGDAVLGGDVPQVLDHLASHGLRQARVEGLPHSAGFHRPQVFDVHRGRPDSEGLVSCPAGGGPGQGVVQV